MTPGASRRTPGRGWTSCGRGTPCPRRALPPSSRRPRLPFLELRETNRCRCPPRRATVSAALLPAQSPSICPRNSLLETTAAHPPGSRATKGCPFASCSGGRNLVRLQRYPGGLRSHSPPCCAGPFHKRSIARLLRYPPGAKPGRPTTRARSYSVMRPIRSSEPPHCSSEPPSPPPRSAYSTMLGRTFTKRLHAASARRSNQCRRSVPPPPIPPGRSFLGSQHPRRTT